MELSICYSGNTNNGVSWYIVMISDPLRPDKADFDHMVKLMPRIALMGMKILGGDFIKVCSDEQNAILKIGFTEGLSRYPTKKSKFRSFCGWVELFDVENIQTNIPAEFRETVNSI